MHFFNGMGWGMGIVWIIGLIVLIVAIWWMIQINNPNNDSNPQEKSALDILKERYAKGEIDKEEFEEKKQQLL